MYEWMRAHRIALEHWHKGQNTTSTWLNYQHHQQFKHYIDVAAYCQARVVQLNQWSYPIPYLAFPYVRDGRKLIRFSSQCDWGGDQFHNNKVIINPRWLNTMRRNIPPGDPHLPPGWVRVFNLEPHYHPESLPTHLLSRHRSGDH